MICKIVNYKVKPDELAACQRAIREFVAAVRKNEPSTFYEAFQIKESTNFVHIMKFKDEQSEQNHRNAEYTLKFVDVLYSRCEEKPVFQDISEIN